MAFSLEECDLVVAELRLALTDGWIQKIRQPNDVTVLFDVRTSSGTVTLFTTVDQQLARIHLTSQKRENPPTPLPFCQFLRSHIEGGRIQEISQEPDDRIVYVNVHKGDKVYVLVIALIGRRANMLVLDHNRLIMRSLKDSRQKSEEPYVPPEKRVSSSPTSPPKATEHTNARNRLDQPPSHLFPVKENLSNKEKEFQNRFPISWAFQCRYVQQEEETYRASLFKQQMTRARKALKLARAKCKALHKDIEKANQYQEYARYGELLKGSLQRVKKGQTTIDLVDYYDPALPTLSLPLDPIKDPVRNMEDYFRKYQKYLGAQTHLVPRLKETESTIAQLENEVAQLKDGTLNPKFSSKASARDVPTTPSRTKKPRPAPALGYRTYTSIDGVSILVGKTAKDNDYLTLKVANPDDLWLHARGMPGSHVVVRLEKGAEVPHETLKDAATLTLWFSDLRKSGKGEVIYTRRKFVRKAKGQKAGAVQITREKSMWIELKEERLTRLKQSMG